MKANFLERVVRFFIDSKLTPLLLVSILLLGTFALLNTPREEEPQLIVPMMDVFVEAPGFSSKEVEERISIPLEKQLAEIPGVKDIASTSMPGRSLVTVVFHIGENEEASLVKLSGTLAAHLDGLPPGVSPPLVKPRSVDDIPMLALTFWSQRYDHDTLRRVVAQLDEPIRSIPDVSETTLIGGNQRQLKIVLDPDKMAAFRVDPGRLITALRGANQELQAGSFATHNTEYLVQVGGFLQSAEAVERLVVGATDGRPVYLSDVAVVEDGPAEAKNLVFFTPGPAASGQESAVRPQPYPAVTLSIAKRTGTNAVVVAEQVLAKVAALKGSLIPAEIHMTVTRNYGDTAQEKSDELLEHLLLAIGGVTLLIALFLGGRAAVVVFVAIPATLALTMCVYYFCGYTLNRVTLFGLILSIGILVDDPIVDIENIVRHYQLPENKGRPCLEVAVEAINEVRSPLILATLAVIFALLPLAFVGGMVGSYARLIPIGSSAAMLFSMVIAFIITPWAAYRLLAGQVVHGQSPEETAHAEEGWTTQIYRRIMAAFIRDRWKRNLFFGLIAVLFVAALALLAAQMVQVKILPHDNNAEFQLIIDMPEGSPLEQTHRVARAIGRYVGSVPEVAHYQLYIGTASPYNFNGLIRRYFLRQSPHLADIQVNLLPKGERTTQSHEIATRMRPAVQQIAQQFGAQVTIAEMPPGPPVLQTLVAEVYGPSHTEQIAVAQQVRQVFEQTPGMVDVDWNVEAPQPSYRFLVDKEKAALHGIPTQQLAYTLQVALGGMSAGLLHLPKEKEAVPLFVQLARHERSSIEDLQVLQLVSPAGQMVPVSELVHIQETTEPPFIYRKNLKRVVYVTGDTAGEHASPLFALFALDQALADLRTPSGSTVPSFFTQPPFLTEQAAVKWDGEWQITYEFLGGVGLAFAAVLVLIYILVAAWFQSFMLPFVVLAPVPLSLIGILPAHSLLGAFFTGASVVGLIAGAGVVIRNSILLVDFAELRRKEGVPLDQAVVDAGAVRFRPMLLTALSMVVGAAVILLDPMFQGLAVSLIAGEVVATFLSRLAVPLLYYVSERGKETSRVPVTILDSDQQEDVPAPSSFVVPAGPRPQEHFREF